VIVETPERQELLGRILPPIVAPVDDNGGRTGVNPVRPPKP
jgi:hypothetical protein